MPTSAQAKLYFQDFAMAIAIIVYVLDFKLKVLR